MRRTSKSPYAVAKGGREGGSRNSERTRQEITVPQPTATRHLEKECELGNAFISSQGRHPTPNVRVIALLNKILCR